MAAAEERQKAEKRRFDEDPRRAQERFFNSLRAQDKSKKDDS